MTRLDANTLAATLAKLDEGMRLFQEGLAELRAGLGQLPNRPSLGGTEVFELIVNRRRSCVTEAVIESIDPTEFDVFLDLVFLRLGCRRATQAVRELSETVLKARDIEVLELMMARQGRPVTCGDSGDPREGGMELNTMRKCIWRLRRALGDDARDPKLIVTESIVHRPGNGFGYRIPRDLHICLVRPVPLHRQDDSEDNGEVQ